jgi:hypothetical protein
MRCSYPRSGRINRRLVHLAQHKSALIAYLVNCGASFTPTPDKTALMYVTFEYPTSIV